MQFLRLAVLVVASVSLVGCSEKDPNKDLKPISADTPKPSAGGATPSGAPSAPGKGGTSTAPAIKAPAVVD